ncbi:hypothetical protein GCM10025876_28770 [Demequina litorisediminis]|uniref:ATP synthase gamma chain n=1 Tax=Demequina litorisediminis TaxID=1849022 RepID=A0ABQ6IHP5_9MICO|nr:hypothetical protein GCM10025876_28770 [Demequina litorisediminis]
MGGQQRVYRQRIRSTQSLKKIFRAMELIAASRIGKARDRVTAAAPYSRAITRAISAVATHSNVDHPLTTERTDTNRVAVLVITADRGMAGAYSANVLREGERLAERLRGEGKEIVPFAFGRRGVGYFKFRKREARWRVAGRVGLADSRHRPGDRSGAVRRVHGIARGGRRERTSHRLHALLVHGVAGASRHPSAADRAWSRASRSRVRTSSPCTSSSPAPSRCWTRSCRATSSPVSTRACSRAPRPSLANRQRAMHTAVENAEDIIRQYTRLANSARQAEITQEISEIVSGADALAAS